MTMLFAGIVLWSFTHLFKAVAPGARSRLVERFGLGPYKGLITLDIVIALVLIVVGWRMTTPVALYAPPMYGSPIPSVAVLLAILLFVSSSTPNNLKRYVRHPQMTAVVLWASGHLLTNGESRSVILFGGLAIWAVLEMIFINRRDGRWQKPKAVALSKDAIMVIVAVAVSILLIRFHASLFGVPAIPT
ncbi:MAG: NnrU family protein [Gammaproteobacteria bacterium]|nr:NnrU family protein [Gammaproteobacteria bacterium]